MSSRVVKAVHGVQQVAQDPPDEIAESAFLREREPREALVERYAAAGVMASHSEKVYRDRSARSHS